jgi:hypothetical protein
MSRPATSCPTSLEVQFEDLGKYLGEVTHEQLRWALERCQEHERRRSVTPYVYPSIDSGIVRMEWEDDWSRGDRPFVVEIDLRERTVTEFYEDGNIEVSR